MWDPLLIDDGEPSSTQDWVPFKVTSRRRDDVVEVTVRGQLDAWTSGTLLGQLRAGLEVGLAEVHIDLTAATCPDRAAILALARCRDLVADWGRPRLLIIQPDPTNSRAPAQTANRRLAVPASETA